jgi:hypothetical protein
MKSRPGLYRSDSAPPPPYAADCMLVPPHPLPKLRAKLPRCPADSESPVTSQVASTAPPKLPANLQQIHHGREFAPHGARNLSIMVTSLLLVAQGIFSPSWSRVCSSRRKESFPASVASSMMRLPSHGNNRGASRIQGEATDAVVPQTGRRSPPD